MSSLAVIAEVIKRAGNVLICGHIMPDGDCLGSVLALGLALEKIGIKATMAGPDPVPAVYAFLPGAEKFVSGDPPEGNYDTLIILDCSVPERLGKGYRELAEKKDLTVINIDHHHGYNPFGRYRYIDPSAAAVGEIVFDLLHLMQVRIDSAIATCLYTAIITDTGSFQYNNTTPNTHRRVAELLECGAPAAQVNIRLYEEKPRAALLLLGKALNSLKISTCGRVSWMTVTLEDLKSAGAVDEHADGLVNYARSVMGVEVGMLFREVSEGKYKVSFRSKKAVDVNRLAALFGGGGHPRAAGCVIQGELEDLKEKIVSAAILAAGGSSL
ncbi:MAG: bifunctional oligoribonuclease/PAP phosphatase NrnA [Pelotomaculum sp.]|uniref:Exopolyphosphatase-related proteins n=1 Tax=Pelotomaculum thermopropionicum (strain DSM 13744 / JCM 10971 / SI) TaxID=370438 RepID=A5D2S2_PELTS|nr:bifunctional oligoribonuclease/PAP phosphatase NrnA [Pelotomaculum sp.]BAF59452.1 exopolyphosphatase-related proteins [Pelotomaculum thermopropionicum SI]